ncbi:VanZ family protein [Moheibacter sediminis]|uniref:VanZ like family protein n=1 Tax=Moheibacter sediminis TaxID=1434700 RepID=A0A1W2BGV7_9FLAO|nr:VanZ family protein [Moheibacter sediminis]SMC71708.1 VanZ like family protein [Moheibacter sediminis]
MQQRIKSLLEHKNSQYFRVSLYAYTVLLFIATLTPLGYFQGGDSSLLSQIVFPHIDKVVHFFMFFFMAILLYCSFNLNKILYFTIPTATGILIEVLQHTTNTGRTFDIFDIAANTAGAFIAFLFIRKR